MERIYLYRKILFKSVILLIRFFVFTAAFLGVYSISYGEEQSDNVDVSEFRHVLILNSYDEMYRWTRDQSRAIADKLKKNTNDVLIHVEYMDTKYHPEKSNLDWLHILYSKKYEFTKIDLIFTTDNAALEFALEHREDLFNDAPIVFGGVTKDAAGIILKGYDRVAGAYEITDPAGTMEAASKINPEIEKVYIINDSTPTGKDSLKQVLDAGIQDKFELRYLNALPIDEILKTVSRLDDKSVVLLCAYTIDARGYKIPADKFAKLISDWSAVPVYDMWNFRIGNGVLGGSLLTGAKAGNDAAELGASILEGKPIGQLKNIDVKATEYIFDYDQLERFDIPLDSLPEGSKIINKPFSFYETYKGLVVGTILAFAVLMIYILLLMNNIKNRKKAEKRAHEANQELSALYEQVYAIDEQLKHELVQRSLDLDKLRVSEENYRMVAEAANDIIWYYNPESGSIHHFGGLDKVLGYADAECANIEAMFNIIEKEDLAYVQGELAKVIQKKEYIFAVDFRVRHKNGKTIWLHTKARVLHDEHGNPIKIVGSHTDITELKEYQNKIWETAYYDELTKLPNRAYMKEYVNNQIRTGTGSASAILYFDIDDFNAINDNFGHNEGDELLIKVGNILREITGENEKVFRQGGDEFAVVFLQYHNRDDIMEFVEKLNEKLAEPVKLSQGAFHITLSGGIVIFPGDGEDYDTLMKNADIAMYCVKNNGKNGLMYFNTDMLEGAKEKLLLDHHLRSAVKEMDFTIQYQPIVDMKTGRVCKFEALIRWKDDELGQVPPSVFIKRAEENGLIVPLGTWILRESCSFATDLALKGYGDVSVSINISPIQLRQKEFVPLVEEILEQTGVKADRIEFEITESILIDCLESSLKILHEVKALGISISLDDFGQGYSSLTYLRMLPINTLKIDKSFLNDYCDTDRNGQIISAIIELAHGMRLKVIAEGVETEDQYEFLKVNDCDMIQGYLISKPVSMQDAERLVASQ